MDGLNLLREARAVGLAVRAEGDRLVIRGPRQAEPVARKLLAHKYDVLPLLARCHGLSKDDPADWQDWYEERAAMRQFEAGYEKAIAERLAYAEAVEAWCERHAAVHDPARCAGCGKLLAEEALLLADGARVHFPRGDGQFDCLIAHGLTRQGRAAEALARLGLAPPSSWRP